MESTLRAIIVCHLESSHGEIVASQFWRSRVPPQNKKGSLANSIRMTENKRNVQLFNSSYGPIISALEILPVPQMAASVAAPVAPLRLMAAQPQARAASPMSDMDGAAGFTPILLDAERCGAVSYEFTVPNNIYTVRLRFVELTRRGAGERFFHVLINGHYVLLNFDIVAQAGGPGKAINREFNISVTNRILKIDFQSVIGEPAIDGIEIVPYEAPEVECAVLPRALTGAGGHGG